MKHVSLDPLSFKEARVFLIWTKIVNIWTHLLGALIYSLIPLDSYSTFRQQYPMATFNDYLMLGIFFSGVTVCFVFSTL